MATVHSKLWAALSPVLPDERVWPVISPQGTDLDDGAFALYQVETQGRDQTFCDAQGLIRAQVMVLFFGRDYDALWTIVRDARAAVLGIRGATFSDPGATTGSDEPYDETLRSYVIGMLFHVDGKDF